jgi:uncharacterized protein (DUF433 family)
MHTVPAFRDTRVPAQTLLDHLESSDMIEDFALEALEEAKPHRLDECTASGHGFCFPAATASQPCQD